MEIVTGTYHFKTTSKQGISAWNRRLGLSQSSSGFWKSNTILTSSFFFPINFKGLNSELNFCKRYPRNTILKIQWRKTTYLKSNIVKKSLVCSDTFNNILSQNNQRKIIDCKQRKTVIQLKVKSKISSEDCSLYVGFFKYDRNRLKHRHSCDCSSCLLTDTPVLYCWNNYFWNLAVKIKPFLCIVSISNTFKCENKAVQCGWPQGRWIHSCCSNLMV